MIKKVLFSTLVIGIGLMACKKDDVTDPGPPPPPSPNSKVTFKFSHNVDGASIIRDSVMFTNLSGNEYSIKNLRYLISDIRLDDLEGNFTEIDQYHLVDLSDPSTLSFAVKDSLKKAQYKAISFYLGFLSAENINTQDYQDLNDANWAFPNLIDGRTAGGYYTLRLEGEYVAGPDTVDYDISIGGNKMFISANDTSFVPNEIISSLPKSSFTLDSRQVEIEFRLNINRLFSNSTGGNAINLEVIDSDFERSGPATDLVSVNSLTAFTLGDIIFGETE